MHKHLRRDFIPNMRKLNSLEAIRVVRNNEMMVENALRINGCYMTEEDLEWLREPGAKYIVATSNQGLISVVKVPGQLRNSR